MNDLFSFIGTSSFSAIVSMVALIISGIAAYNAIKARKSIGIDHIIKSQIDQVNKIIEQLNEAKLDLTFWNLDCHGQGSGSGYAVTLNLFEVAKYDVLDKVGFNKNYEDVEVCFNQNSNQIANLKQYIIDPNTPKQIADELIRFHTFDSEYRSNSSNIAGDYQIVELKSGILDENILLKTPKKRFIEGDAQCMKTWLNFKECSKQLRITIEDWLKLHGISQNNIREDYRTFPKEMYNPNIKRV